MERIRSALRTKFLDRAINEELRKVDLEAVQSITLTPDGLGVVYSENSGEVFWNSTIDGDVGDCLRSSTKDRRPVRIAIGTHNRYFVRFSDGEVEYSGDDAFTCLIMQATVIMVAFGKDVNSYIILYKDGRVVVSNVPQALTRILIKNANKNPKPSFVALGPNGQFFIRFGNDIHYGNMADDAQKVLDECPGRITEVSFGKDNGLVVRYEHVA